jgi:hypothetical protein
MALPSSSSSSSSSKVEALIPVEEKHSFYREADVEPDAEPEHIVILTYKTEQIAKCASYMETRTPKEIEVKSMFNEAKHVKGQRWRTSRLKSSKPISKEFVKCIMAIPESSYIVAARDTECVVFYYVEDYDSRSGFRVTDSMTEILSDVVVHHWTFLHPSGNNKQNIMEAVKQLGDWGTLVAGNMKVQNMKTGALLSFAECQKELANLTMVNFHAFVADSKLAKRQKQASPLQESVLVIQKELNKWLEWCERSSSTIFDINDGPVYPDGFNKKDHSNLMGYELTQGSKQPAQISLKD